MTRIVSGVTCEYNCHSGSFHAKTGANGKWCFCCAVVPVCLVQQPLSDFDAQRKRLVLIKNNLRGWRALGCELLECYQ